MPSDGRRATIVGTPVSLPTRPATASSAEPMTLPTTVASIAALSPSAGTSRLPATSTSSPTPRSPQSTPKCSPLSARRSRGTGVISS